MRSGCESTGPRSDEVELHVPTEALKVPLVTL